MHQLVQDYLNKKSKEKNELAIKKKNELLLRLNLFEKEYSDKNEYSSEYPEGEWDSKTGTTKYFKRIPVQVSDEEYAEILKYQKKESNSTNTISIIFKVFAWIIFVGGFIVGIVLGKDKYDDFSFGLALVYWSAFFVAGMLYYGFAEIIQLLTDIKNK